MLQQLLALPSDDCWLSLHAQYQMALLSPDPSLVALSIVLKSKGCCAGYSLNALVDFPTDDPIEIIKRLMIGSEGTFGFVSRATYNCVPEWPDKVLAALLRLFSVTGSMLHAERRQAQHTFCGGLGADGVLHVAPWMNSQTPA